MKKRKLSVLTFFALGSGFFSSAHAQSDALDSNIYVENTASVFLHKLETQENGTKLLRPSLTLPSESTLSIEITELARQLELQLLSPEQVNYSYTDAKNSPIRKSKDGFVCGLRVIDVPDEDIQETEGLEEMEFCLANKLLSRFQPVEGDEEHSKNAFLSYLKTKDVSALVELAKKIRADQEYQSTQIRDISATKVASPIKGCGKGCLQVTSGFGKRKAPVKGASRQHKGVDLRARSGTPVVAALSGKILANKTQRKGRKLTGYGHYVIMSHPETGMQTKYAHLTSFKRKAGQSVAQGEVIASSGNTGIGTGAHLHFETIKGSKPVNPVSFLKSLISSGHDWMRSLGFLFA